MINALDFKFGFFDAISLITNITDIAPNVPTNVLSNPIKILFQYGCKFLRLIYFAGVK